MLALLFVFSNVIVVSMQAYTFVICRFQLDRHDLLYGLADVESSKVLSEFVSLYLSIIKQVLDCKVHKIRRRFLNFHILLELPHDELQFLNQVCFAEVFVLEILVDEIIEILLFVIQSFYGIERIS
jgi:hypothetical protein